MKLIAKNIVSLTLIFLVAAVYIYFAGRYEFKFPDGPYNYFSHQAYSFLHGKLSIFSTDLTHDLSVFNLKRYLYWGPSPVLFIAPFVVLFGLHFSDALYTAIISSFSPLVLFFIMGELAKAGLIKTKVASRFILSLFFAVGTPLFLLSVHGGVWFTSQAVNTLYILISLLFLFRFRNNLRPRDLIVASVFFALAAWGRSSFALYLPLYLFLVGQKGIKPLLLFGLPLVIFLGVSLTYNYLRFGDVRETGYSFHKLHPHFAADKEKYGIINLVYLPKNFYYNFLNFPKPVNRFPFFNFDQEGNSILFTSPFFIFLALGFKKYLTKFKKNLFQIVVLFTGSAVVLSLLLFFGTGWVQFGARYLLDAVPLFMILLADVIEKVPRILVFSALLFSLIVNILGVMWFFTI